MKVFPSTNRASGRLRAKQVERILSGDEARDPVGAFLAEMVQDLRDVARAEVPSGVAARHLLKMRMATEMGEGGPEPLLDVEEAAIPPPRPLERRRRTVAALGLAAAMVVMVGVAASITGPRTGGTRAGGILRSDVPRLPQDGPGRVDRFVRNEARSSASTREPGQPPSGGSTGSPNGSSDQSSAGVIDAQGSSQPTGNETGGGGGSVSANTGSGDEPRSGGGSGSAGDVTGRGTSGDNRDTNDKGHGKGRGKGSGKSRGDRARAGGDSEKGSSKKP